MWPKLYEAQGSASWLSVSCKLQMQSSLISQTNNRTRHCWFFLSMQTDKLEEVVREVLPIIINVCNLLWCVSKYKGNPFPQNKTTGWHEVTCDQSSPIYEAGCHKVTCDQSSPIYEAGCHKVTCDQSSPIYEAGCHKVTCDQSSPIYEAGCHKVTCDQSSPIYEAGCHKVTCDQSSPIYEAGCHTVTCDQSSPIYEAGCHKVTCDQSSPIYEAEIHMWPKQSSLILTHRVLQVGCQYLRCKLQMQSSLISQTNNRTRHCWFFLSAAFLCKLTTNLNSLISQANSRVHTWRMQ